MTDSQKTEAGAQRLLQLGTVALTVLSPVINMLAARLADRLERGGKRPMAIEDTPTTKKIVLTQSKPENIIPVKQPISDALQERGEILVQELEDLVARGTKLSQSLIARSSEATHELVDRGNDVSQDLLKRSEEIRKELGKRGKKLNKDLNQRSQQVAKELNKRSQQVAKELNKRSQQATRQLSEHNGMFWIIAGFAVGLSAAGITAYLLIRQRVRQQQQLEAEQSYPVSQNGYLNINTSPVQVKDTASATKPTTHQPSLAEENVPAVAVAEQENKVPVAQSTPTGAAFVGIVGTRRYYPISTPLEQLVTTEAGKNDVIYFKTEEEAQAQGYVSDVFHS